MNIKNTLFIVTVIIFSLMNVNSALTNAIQLPGHELKISTQSGISINGDAQLATSATSGNGSITNPYIIASLSLDCGSDFISGTPTVGIVLSHITKYFVLSNITVQNCYNGIELDNNQYGNVSNSFITHSDDAIVLSNSMNFTIQNNTLSNNYICGISVVQSNYTNILTNIINKTGTSGNGEGISISQGYYDTVTNNTVLQCDYAGLDAYLSSYTALQNNTSIKNYRGIIIRADGAFVSNNLLLNNSYGIEIDPTSEYNTLTNNTLKYNTEVGLYDYNGFFNILTNNTIYHNLNDGIQLYIANNNSIVNNTITFNNGIGLNFLYSNNNTAKNNLILDNTININQTGSVNIIYDQNYNNTTTTQSGTSSNIVTSTTNTSSSKTKNLPSFAILWLSGAFIVIVLIRKRK